MKIYIAILPWDYTSAEAVAFGSREDAQAFIDDHAGAQRHYASISEQTVTKPQKGRSE